MTSNARSSPIFHTSETTYNTRPTRCFSCPSLKQSALALVLATVLAIGVALAAYFGFGLALKWTAIAGAGTLALSSTLLFTAIACANGSRSAPATSAKRQATASRSHTPASTTNSHVVSSTPSQAPLSTEKKERNDKQKEKEKEVEGRSSFSAHDRPVPSAQLRKPLPWQPPRFDGDEREDPKYWETTPLTYDMDDISDLSDLKEELQLVSFKHQLNKNYGQKIPHRCLFLQDTTNASLRKPLYVAQQRIFFMDEESFLKLPLETLAEYTQVELHAVFERLRYLDPRHFEERCFSENEKTDFLTLGDLLQMGLGDFCNFSTQIPQSCYALVPPRLFPDFIQQLESEEEIDWCFPTQFPAQRAWTQEKLARCNIEHLKNKMHLFSPEQLALLPPELFFVPEFPWDKISQTMYYLTLLPTEVLNDARFPWDRFVHFEGFGIFVREKATQEQDPLLLQHLPWDELLLYPRTLEELFVIEQYQYIDPKKREVLQRLFSQLTSSNIDKIAGRLKAAHLSFIPTETLMELDFPWLKFFKKENIGVVLHDLLTQSILQLPYLPLADLPDQEVKFLFTGKNDKYFLGILDIDQIRIFAKNLTSDALPHLKRKHLYNEDFPWTTFCAKPGIGEQLRKLALEQESSKMKLTEGRDCDLSKAQRKELEMPSLLTFVDLATLSKTEKELEQLFQIRQYDTDLDRMWQLSSLLEPLGMEFLDSIAHRLSVTHLRFFSCETLKKVDFPWDKFLVKPGFGGEIRYWMSLNQFNLFKLNHIDWQKWSEIKASELKALFEINNRDNYGHRKLQSDQVALFAKHFTLEHLCGFNEIALNSNNFPWVHFFKFAGVGQAIRELVIEEKLSLQYVPLTKMPVKEISKLFRYESFADEKMTLLIQSISDQDLVSLHAKNQLIPLFERLMLPDQRRLLGLPVTEE